MIQLVNNGEIESSPTFAKSNIKDRMKPPFSESIYFSVLLMITPKGNLWSPLSFYSSSFILEFTLQFLQIDHLLVSRRNLQKVLRRIKSLDTAVLENQDLIKM